MCLAVPGKLVEVTGEGETRMGKVDFAGVARQVSLAFTPEANPGDYVLVHVGFALQTLDEEAARETLEELRALGESFDETEGAAAADASR
jgi:hydrogenase expression/formation protein HypC